MSVQEAATGKTPDNARKSAAERLCEKATDLFYKRGIRAVGVDEIVNETGVTKPTLYRNFASKDDLVAVCLRKQMDEGFARWQAIAARHADDPWAEMRAHLNAWAEEIAAPDYRGCPASNTAVEFPEASHPARLISDECKAGMRQRLGDVARRMGIGDPDALADGLVLLVEGACSSRHTSGSQGPSSTLVATAEMLIAAYAARVKIDA
ncbi:TetR/AcrR family transcriptional regulator [Glacieibacterium sp.]|uniref:TetR/AcrR family transcriptional regulator n=1 Tax=Glacieibacterium sp. TaxID=2860237 RepID=UPI003AFF8E48